MIHTFYMQLLEMGESDKSGFCKRWCAYIKSVLHCLHKATRMHRAKACFRKKNRKKGDEHFLQGDVEKGGKGVHINYTQAFVKGDVLILKALHYLHKLLEAIQQGTCFRKKNCKKGDGHFLHGDIEKGGENTFIDYTF